MPERAIVDTSVLIALEKINLLEILCKIYDEIILPEAVIQEFGMPSIKCYSVKKVNSQLVRLLMNDLNLGKGESEVIALASETGIKTIIDDVKARQIAERLELKVTGTIGVLLKAEQLGVINNAYEKIKELREKGFYISDELFDRLKNHKD
jgi:predicted nucleic acid-binding protein